MPVLTTTLSLDRSNSSRGTTPPFSSSPIHRGLTPRFDTPWSAATRSSTRRSGISGEPS